MPLSRFMSDALTTIAELRTLYSVVSLCAWPLLVTGMPTGSAQRSVCLRLQMEQVVSAWCMPPSSHGRLN